MKSHSTPRLYFLLALWLVSLPFSLHAQTGAALDFDGTNDYAVLPSNATLDVSQFTIETWLKWDRNSATAVDFICGRGLEQMEIHLGNFSNNSVIRFIPVAGVLLDAPTSTLPQGTWTHLACVYNPSAGLAKMYVNGVEVVLTNNGTNPLTTPLAANGVNMVIGARSLLNYPFKGQMDEFRLWNRALTQSEIQTKMSCEIPTTATGLVINQHFNQGTAAGNNAAVTTLTDASGNNNNFTLTNFALTGSTSNWIGMGGVTTGTSCVRPFVNASFAAAVVTDNAPTGASATDVLEYTAVVSNSGSVNATGVRFETVLDNNTTLVAGSLTATPIAVNDAYTCVGNVGITVNAVSGVLTNDVSPTNTTRTVTAASGATTNGAYSIAADGSFSYTPNVGYTGTDNFTYTLNTGTTSATGTVNITVSGLIWFVDASAAISGFGTLSSPFKSIINIVGTAAGQSIFFYTGGYSGFFTALGSQKLIGQGATASLATITGYDFTNAPSTVPSTGGTNPTWNSAALFLSSDNDVEGINFNSIIGTTITGSSVGALKIRDVSVVNTDGKAIQITAGGPLDVQFKSLSAANTVKGISVNGSGNFEVLGTGTIAGSGGTINNMIIRGAEFNGCTNIVLKNMNFTNANTTAGASSATDYSTANGAITLNNVTNVTLTKIAISGTTRERGITGKTISNFTLNGGSTITDCGDGVNEGCLYLQDLTGTCSISDATLSKGSENIARVFNSTGNLTLNIGTDATTTIFDDTQTQNANYAVPGALSAERNYCFIYTTSGASTATATLNVRNTSFLKAGTHGFKVISDGSGTVNANIKSCIFDNDNATFSPNDQGGSIELTAFNTANLNYNILNNSCRGKDIDLINIVAQVSSNAQGRVNNNTVTHSGTNSAGNGINLSAQGNSNIISEVIGNNVSGMASGVGILATATGGDGKMNATIKNNTVTITDPNASHNIQVQAGNSGSTFTNTVCANVANNRTTRPDFINGFNFRVRAVTTGTHRLYLQGIGSIGARDVWINNSNSPAGADSQGGNYGVHIFTSSNAVPASLATCAIVSNPTYSIVQPPTDVTNVTESTNNNPTTNGLVEGTTTENAAATPDRDPSVFSPSGGSPEGILSGETVTVNGSGSGFTLPVGKSTTIKFRATINTGIAAGTCAVSTQGTVSGSNFANVLTDDPSVAGSANPTSTTITVAPSITTCPTIITASIAAGLCTSTQTFAATVGCPTSTLTYKIGATTITSPYAFPVGTTTVDVTASSGVVPNATCSFTVTVTRDALPATTTNNALNFDGTNDFVEIKNCSGAALDVLNALTIEYWFKGSNNNSAVRLQQDGSNYIVAGVNGKHIISSDGGTAGGLSVGTAATDGNWHHIAMTWQRNTVNGFKSYLDGQLVAQRTSLDVALPTITSGMYLGALNGTSEFMTGTLDEVRIWNVVRTQAEIDANRMGCAALSPNSNLVMYYRFNHGAADVANTGINTMVNSANSTTYRAALNNFSLTSSSSNWTSSPLCTDIYTWTGAASTDWANVSNWSPTVVPTGASSIAIPATTNGLMLAANRTINQLTFTGTAKIKLDGFNLTVNSLNGGSSNAYVVTSGTTGPNPILTIKNVSTATLFPVGPSETVYAPATITNNVARDFSIKVGTAITNAAVLTKTVNLQWDVTPSVLTGNSATLALGWPTTSQGSAFTPTTNVFVGHYNTTLSAWDRFRPATITGLGTGVDPYVATVSGVDVFSPFAVSNLNALPIELLDFKGTPQYNGNFLTWTTANEVNNKGFQVERAPQPPKGTFETWEVLGFVNAQDKATTYNFLDKATSTGAGGTYYRLRQIDNDGKETRSKVISIERKDANSRVLTVYPNPAKGVLTIETEEQGAYQIIDPIGRFVLQGQISKSQTKLDIAALPSGMYLLRINTRMVKFFKE